MKMKKLLSACLALVMAAGMLSGCGNGGSGSDAAEQYQDSDEKLTITWLGYPRNPGASEGSVPELALEEKFNVDIKPLFYEENKFNDKKTMLMAGGEIPDLIYELDPANMVQDVDQDFVVEVPYETIKTYAPEYYNYLNEYAPIAWIYSRYDGKNYGVPNFNHGHMLSQQVTYRGDWLKKLGKEVPKTLDELHDVLYAFANEDPDGNGKKDTYGTTVTSTHYQAYFPEIFGANGCLPFDWQEVDGEIVYGGLTDACKDTLKTLATWYSEGIIDPDFVIGEGNGDKFVSGTLGYAVAGQTYYDPTSDTTTPAKLKANNPKGEVAVGFLPTGKNGDAGVRAWGRACHVVSFGNTEGHGTKVPRMLKMFEGMFTDKDLAYTIRVGNEGESWEKAAADTTKTQSFVMTEAYKDSAAQRTAGLSTDFAGPTFWAPAPVDYDTYVSTRSDAFNAWANEWLDEKYCLTDVFCKVDVVPSAADYIIDLRTKQMQLMSEIINGTKTIDAYSEFETMWKNGGGETLTKEARELGTELEKLYDEVGVKAN